jgi:hypothetical protein
LFTKLDLGAPASVLPRDSMPEIETLGKPLEKIALDRQLMTETSPFWLGFRRHYPGAWGMVGFTRVAFNDLRTQALVFTSHSCGSSCRNDDTWLLERAGPKWRIVERIPRTSDNDVELDSLRYLGVDANPRAYKPRRVHGVFVAKPSGTPLSHLRFTVHINRDSSFLQTDDLGRYEIDDLPLMAGITFDVPCQEQPMLGGARSRYSTRPLQVAQLGSHGGLDSTVNVPVDLRRCLLHRRARPLATAQPSPQARASGYPDATDAAVYRALLDDRYPDLQRPVLLFPYVHRLWDYDFSSELFRLAKQGIIDSTVTARLGMMPKDSAWLRPNVAFGHPVVVIGKAERKFLEEQAEEFAQTGEQRDLSLMEMAKEAYPGAVEILSLSRIAYNEKFTEAIVQIASGSEEPWNSGETMILEKNGKAWRVVRHHVERESTSGEMTAGRCEPVDAVPSVPRLDQMERFVGDADITVIPTEPGWQKYSGTSRYRFIPNDSLHRYYWLPMKGDKRPPMRLPAGQQKLGRVQTLDATGKVINNRGELERTSSGAGIVFAGSPDLPEGVVEFDGPYEEFKILRVNGRQFFGSWRTESGPSYPIKGYFCGRLR